jgi:hypothetical protein
MGMKRVLDELFKENHERLRLLQTASWAMVRGYIGIEEFLAYCTKLGYAPPKPYTCRPAGGEGGP